MNFTKEELTAITQLGIKMAMADDRIVKEELDVIVCELKHFRVSEHEAKSIFQSAQTMSAQKAINNISSRNYEQKKRVAAYLGVIMAIDGDLNGTEQEIWALTSSMCSLPNMTIAEARDIIFNS